MLGHPGVDSHRLGRGAYNELEREVLADAQRRGLRAVEHEVAGRFDSLRGAAGQLAGLSRRRGRRDRYGEQQRAHHFFVAKSASPFFQAMRSPTSAGRSASQPRAHTACSAT